MSKRIHLLFVGVILANLFMGTILFAAQEKKQVVLNKKDLDVANFLDIDFPNEFGDIKEIWSSYLEGKNQNFDNRIILHIRDAHCHFEAQSNIADILSDLMRKYNGLGLVAVEGSVGVIDTSPFSEFSDNEVKEEVATYFMKKGKVTGPEFLSIMKKSPFVLYGIENREYYNANLKAFMDLLPFREESQQLCEVLQVATGHIAEFVFPEELIKLIKQKELFDKGGVGFFEYSVFLYVNYLKFVQNNQENLDELAKNYTNFKHLVVVTKLQPKIKSAVLDAERNKILGILEKLLDEQQKTRLVSRSLQLRIGRMSPTQYYVYLESLLHLMQDRSDNLKDWQNKYIQTKEFIEYSHIYEMIDKTQLFKEMDKIIDVIAYKIMKTDEEKKLYDHDRRLRVLRKLYYLQFGQDEYDIYLENKDKFKSSNFTDIIYEYSRKYKLHYHRELVAEDYLNFDKFAPIAEDFYKYAKLRDDVLLQNTFKAMEMYDAEIAFLITGGFHTQGIKDKLKKRKISYAVIAPQITEDQPDDLYIEVLSNQKTPFEEFLSNIQE